MSYDEHLISMAGGDGDVLDLDAILAAIEARAEAATEGPWITERHDLTLYVVDATGELDPISLGYVGNRPERNAEFIAHARTDVPALLALVREQQARIERVGALHKPVKKWEPYEGAGYSFNTREEALMAGGEEDLGIVAIEAGPQYFEVCKECGRIESEQLSESGEEWGYRESLYPCPTIAALTATEGA